MPFWPAVYQTHTRSSDGCSSSERITGSKSNLVKPSGKTPVWRSVIDPIAKLGFVMAVCAAAATVADGFWRLREIFEGLLFWCSGT